MLLLLLSCLSHVQLCAALWTVLCQAPLCMGFSRQEYWSGLPFSSSGDLPEPRIESGSLALQMESLPLSHQGSLRDIYMENSNFKVPVFNTCICSVISSWDLKGHKVSERRRQWHPTPVLLPGKSHGWRSLVGCRPWNR